MGSRCASVLSVSLVLFGACTDEPSAPRVDPNAPKTLADSVFGAGNVEWFVPDAAGAWTMRPALDDSRVLMERDMELGAGGSITRPSEIVALDRATGVMVWHSPFISAENLAVSGNVIGAVWGSLPLFDRTTGVEKNHFNYGSTALSTNVVTDGVLFFVGSHNGHALAVDPGTGSSTWDANVAGASPKTATGVAVTGNLVVYTLTYAPPTSAQPDSGIVAVLFKSGAPRWRIALPVDPQGSGIVEAPVITGGLIVVKTRAHKVYALDVATGAQSWAADASYGSTNVGSDGVAACDGNIIVATGDLGLASLSPTDGSERWHVSNIGAGSLHGIQCLRGTVITSGGTLQLFDAATGSRLAQYPLLEPFDGERSFWIPAATRDETHLYVGTSHGFAKVKVP
jgi:outer membrane protein assembly factor BamB